MNIAEIWKLKTLRNLDKIFIKKDLLKFHMPVIVSKKNTIGSTHNKEPHYKSLEISNYFQCQSSHSALP